MEPQAFLGIVVLIILIGYFLRTMKDIMQGVILIVLALIASGLIIGGTPEIGNLPMVGQYFSAQSMVGGIPGTILEKVEQVAWNMEILGVQKDAEGNLMIIVQNTGQFALEGIKIKANNQTLHILNEPEKIGKGQVFALIADHKPEGMLKIEIEAGQAKAETLKEL